jgi:hypothetical protein
MINYFAELVKMNCFSRTTKLIGGNYEQTLCTIPSVLLMASYMLSR